MKKFIIAVIFIFYFLQVKAQHFNFSQIHFGESRYNPALITADNNAFITLIHRAQQTETNIDLRTNFISISYPLAQEYKGKSLFSIGGYILDDKTSPYGIFKNSEYAGILSSKISISKFSTLSFGVRGAYHSTRIDAGNYFTESQYIEEIGFDRSIGTGEIFNGYSTNYFSISTGINFQQYYRGDEVLRLGISILELPSFEQDLKNSSSNFTLQSNSKIRLTHNRQGSLYLNSIGRISRNRISMYNGLGYFYQTRGFVDQLIFLIHYNSAGSFTAGFQLDQKRFRAGVSFDLGVGKGRTAYKNIVEIGFKLKGIVNKTKKPKRRKREKSSDNELSHQQTKNAIPLNKDNLFQEQNTISPSVNAVEVLQEDSSFATNVTSGKPGLIAQELEIADLEKQFFMFKHNSDTLYPSSVKSLYILSRVLKEHPYLQVNLTGYTDSSGSSAYNLELSLRRAGSVQNLLIKMGIEKERILINGRGEEHPIVQNDTEENRAKNRRVEMNFIY